MNKPLPSTKSHHNIQLPHRGLCAHRGAMTTHPENTLPAFREAIKCGAHMIEFDVQLTKDNALIVMHDPAVDRTTNGHGPIAEFTCEEIRRLDAGSWKSYAFQGEKVPLLDEVLSIMPVNIWLNIHLKGGKALGRQFNIQPVVAPRIMRHGEAFISGTRLAQRPASCPHVPRGVPGVQSGQYRGEQNEILGNVFFGEDICENPRVALLFDEPVGQNATRVQKQEVQLKPNAKPDILTVQRDLRSRETKRLLQNSLRDCISGTGLSRLLPRPCCVDGGESESVRKQKQCNWENCHRYQLARSYLLCCPMA